jgi:hypothetical protein
MFVFHPDGLYILFLRWSKGQGWLNVKALDFQWHGYKSARFGQKGGCMFVPQRMRA